eukprot:Gb_31999 [translate_table: standard]
MKRGFCSSICQDIVHLHHQPRLVKLQNGEREILYGTSCITRKLKAKTGRNSKCP